MKPEDLKVGYKYLYEWSFVTELVVYEGRMASLNATMPSESDLSYKFSRVNWDSPNDMWLFTEFELRRISPIYLFQEAL